MCERSNGDGTLVNFVSHSWPWGLLITVLIALKLCTVVNWGWDCVLWPVAAALVAFVFGHCWRESVRKRKEDTYD